MERKLMSETLQGQGAHLQTVRKRLKGSPANAFMIAVILYIYTHTLDGFKELKLVQLAQAFRAEGVAHGI